MTSHPDEGCEVSLSLDLRSYRADVDVHSHDHHQLVLPISGRLEMEIAASDGAVAGGSGAVVAAGVEHGFAARGENRFIVADIPVSMAPELARLPEFIELDDTLGQYILFLHGQLEKQGTRPASVRINRQMLLLLVQLLTERFGETLRVDQRLEKARGYLDANLSVQVTISQLAAFANLSPRQLNTLFQRYFEMSPSEYLLAQRMQLAWRLVAETTLPVQQIAFQCGNQDLSAFSHRFSRHFGHSPRKICGAADSTNK